MCSHQLYAGVTADGRESVYAATTDCSSCERQREWADEYFQDAADDAAAQRDWNEDTP